MILAQGQVRARDDLEDRFTLRTTIAASFVSSWIDDFASRAGVDASARLGTGDGNRRGFREMVRAYRLEAALLLDDRGRVLQVWPRSPEIIGTELASKYSHLKQAVDGERAVSNVVPSAVEGIPVVAVAIPFQSQAGHRVFSGAFSISRTPIGKPYLENVTPILGSRVYLVDANGKPLSTNLDAPDSIDPQDARLFTTLRSGVTGTHEFGESIASVEAVKGTPWRIVVTAPADELFEPIRGWSHWTTWITFAALVVAVAAAWWAFEKVGRSIETSAELYAELARRNAQVEEASAGQRRFISAASHELRTPLTSILGYLELLPGEEDEEVRKQALSVVDRNAQRLLGLVDSLMQVFRNEVETFASDGVDFTQIVTESVHSVMPAASSRSVSIELRADISVTVLGDRELLGQVADNLLSNAVKFSHEGGQVKVAVDSSAFKAQLTVADQGIGVPPDEVDSLFERFFRASTARGARVKGTGLGLAISRAIIEKHGGHVDVSSVLGEGTTFTVELPLAERRI